MIVLRNEAMRQLQAKRECRDRRQERDLFSRFMEVKKSGTRGPEYQRLRCEVVVAHLGLVRYLAMKFSKRGEAFEDLMQVGTLGLIKAVDRFDSDRGVEFATYAGPTIAGELKRHFRDKGWAMRMPRRLQELNAAVNRAIDQLAVETGRSPSARDLAQHLHASEEEILEAQEVGHAYHLLSLDFPRVDKQDRFYASLERYIGVEDPRLSRSEDILNLERAFEMLDGRERLLIYWRFYQQLSQTEIARRLEVSQMHVSRLQQKALEKMRQALQT